MRVQLVQHGQLTATLCLKKRFQYRGPKKQLYSVSTGDFAPAEKTSELPSAKLTGRFGIIIPKRPINISQRSVATVRG